MGVLSFEPITPHLGIEIGNVDLASDLADETIDEIKWLLADHGILLFRDQRLSARQQSSFMLHFGELLISPRKEYNHPEQPAVARLGNATENGKSIAFLNEVGIEWHVDGTGRPFDGVYTSLYAVKAPRQGGETLYASGIRGAEILPDGLRRKLAGRTAVYNYSKIHRKLTEASNNGVHLSPETRAAQPDSRHLILRAHPLSGRESIYITPEEMLYIEGYSPEESRALALEVVAAVSREDLVYAHRWRPGDFVLHDNSSSLHSTTEYTYTDDVRLMHRVIAYQAAASVRRSGEAGDAG